MHTTLLNYYSNSFKERIKIITFTLYLFFSDPVSKSDPLKSLRYLPVTVGIELWSGTGLVGTKEGFVFAVEGFAVAVVNILEAFPPPTFQT